MWLSWANLLRFVVTGLAVLHVFTMYGLGRNLSEGFGFSLPRFAWISLFTFIMLVPFCWAFPVAELPGLYRRFIRPSRLRKAGRCTDCGYDLRGTVTGQCPECGQSTTFVTPVYFTRGMILRLVGMIVTAWVMGSVIGEAWFLSDEWRFMREVEVRLAEGETGEYERPRAWPHQSGHLWYDPDIGFWAHD